MIRTITSKMRGLHLMNGMKMSKNNAVIQQLKVYLASENLYTTLNNKNAAKAHSNPYVIKIPGFPTAS